MHVLVLLPATLEAADPAGATVVRWQSSDDILRALSVEFDAAVLWSDGLEGPAIDRVAAAVRHAERRVIEVRAERWDGFSRSELSAACSGVISGFGVAGIAAALEAVGD